MAGLRNVAIALARLHGFANIASALRAFAHQPRRALAAVGVTVKDTCAGDAATPGPRRP
jgi:hypothetical protein